MNPNPINSPVGIVDPNPTEPAKMTIKLSADINTMIGLNYVSFREALSILYAEDIAKVLCVKLLDDLRLYGHTIVYTGTVKQCVLGHSIFKNLGLTTSIDEIK